MAMDRTATYPPIRRPEELDQSLALRLPQTPTYVYIVSRPSTLDSTRCDVIERVFKAREDAISYISTSPEEFLCLTRKKLE